MKQSKLLLIWLILIAIVSSSAFASNEYPAYETNLTSYWSMDSDNLSDDFGVNPFQYSVGMTHTTTEADCIMGGCWEWDESTNANHSRADFFSTWDTSEAWTLNFWVKIADATPAGAANAILYDTFQGALAYLEGHSAHGGQSLALYLGSDCSSYGISGGAAGSRANYTDNTWIMVTTVFNKTAYTAYADGQVDIIVTSGTAICSEFGLMHNRIDAPWGNFGVPVDERALWNRALNHTEILELFTKKIVLTNMTAPPPLIQHNLLSLTRKKTKLLQQIMT